jgi:DNA-directed RNA polymerase specialized sigma24 family protein
MAPDAPLENRVLRARAQGEVSADDAFETLYREYGRTVSGWLAVRVDSAAVDDLAQDVWLIFYSRFRRWEFGTEMESPEARPVLSFLFRTCQFVARGHKRLASSRVVDPLETPDDVSIENGRPSMLRKLEATRALAIARSVCRENEVDVLLAKLAGMSGREIAATLSITESVVDHRYRNAIAKLKKKLNPREEKEKGRDHG